MSQLEIMQQKSKCEPPAGYEPRAGCDLQAGCEPWAV